MKKHNLMLLLTGKSGSGKTTIADELERQFGLNVLKSYTTRPPRANDTSHTFVSDEEFDRLTDIVAYTEYNGYRYCATAEQVENSDVYVIDPAGVEFFKEHYHGGKRVIDLYIKAGSRTRAQRMFDRGDEPDKIESRLDYDQAAFANYIPYAYTRNGKHAEIDDVVWKIAMAYKTWNGGSI